MWVSFKKTSRNVFERDSSKFLPGHWSKQRTSKAAFLDSVGPAALSTGALFFSWLATKLVALIKFSLTFLSSPTTVLADLKFYLTLVSIVVSSVVVICSLLLLAGLIYVGKLCIFSLIDPNSPFHCFCIGFNRRRLGESPNNPNRSWEIHESQFVSKFSSINLSDAWRAFSTNLSLIILVRFWERWESWIWSGLKRGLNRWDFQSELHRCCDHQWWITTGDSFQFGIQSASIGRQYQWSSLRFWKAQPYSPLSLSLSLSFSLSLSLFLSLCAQNQKQLFVPWLVAINLINLIDVLLFFYLFRDKVSLVCQSDSGWNFFRNFSRGLIYAVILPTTLMSYSHRYQFFFSEMIFVSSLKA